MDNNFLALFSAGAMSKIESATNYLDNTTNPTTPLLFQTHGGIPANGQTTWRTDYSRDSHMQADDRDTYVIYRPNFGSLVQIPTSVETMEYYSLVVPKSIRTTISRSIPVLPLNLGNSFYDES